MSTLEHWFPLSFSIPIGCVLPVFLILTIGGLPLLCILFHEETGLWHDLEDGIRRRYHFSKDKIQIYPNVRVQIKLTNSSLIILDVEWLLTKIILIFGICRRDGKTHRSISFTIMKEGCPLDSCTEYSKYIDLRHEKMGSRRLLIAYRNGVMLYSSSRLPYYKWYNKTNCRTFEFRKPRKIHKTRDLHRRC